eukprot:3358688-Pyramimonas_sp.AAC.1
MSGRAHWLRGLPGTARLVRNNPAHPRLEQGMAEERAWQNRAGGPLGQGIGKTVSPYRASSC